MRAFLGCPTSAVSKWMTKQYIDTVQITDYKIKVSAVNADKTPIYINSNAKWICSDGRTGEEWGIEAVKAESPTDGIFAVAQADIMLERTKDNACEYDVIVDPAATIGYFSNYGLGDGKTRITAYRVYEPEHIEDAYGNWIDGSWSEWKSESESTETPKWYDKGQQIDGRPTIAESAGWYIDETLVSKDPNAAVILGPDSVVWTREWTQGQVGERDIIWYDGIMSDEWVYSDGQEHAMVLESGILEFGKPTYAFKIITPECTYKSQTYSGMELEAVESLVKVELVEQMGDRPTRPAKTIIAYRKYTPAHWENNDNEWILGEWSDWSYQADGKYLYWADGWYLDTVDDPAQRPGSDAVLVSRDANATYIAAENFQANRQWTNLKNNKYRYFEACNPNRTPLSDGNSTEWAFSDGQNRIIKADESGNLYVFEDPYSADNRQIDIRDFATGSLNVQAEDAFKIQIEYSDTTEHTCIGFRRYTPGHWENTETGEWIKGSWSDWDISNAYLPGGYFKKFENGKLIVQIETPDGDNYEYTYAENCSDNDVVIPQRDNMGGVIIRTWTNADA